MTTQADLGIQKKWLLVAGVLAILVCLGRSAFAAEGAALDDARSTEAAIAAAQSDAVDHPEKEMPANLQDLTKGEGALVGQGIPWMMGPVGIIGFKNRISGGDQIRVMGVSKGSPADGKVLPGDVVLGLNGRKFRADEDINRVVGDAIIKAEEESSGGRLTLNIWRDRNWSQRMEAQNQAAVDVDEIFKDVMASERELYLWQSEDERTDAVKLMRLGNHPIDPETLDVEVKLEVMGTYSDTSPWDCPVATKIRDNALKVISARIAKEGERTGGHDTSPWPDILALVASGKPEYVEQAKQWVHSQKMLQDMHAPGRVKGRCWPVGFDQLERAIYLDATGDEYVKAQVRFDALSTALGQSGGGAWGHTFAYPGGNFGKLHGMLSNNYGAVNNAGGRCFMLLALAKKNGIEHPEITDAIARSTRFFGTFVDKGAVPYGYHPPVRSKDDSNGRHYGVGYAFYALGDWYKAKYYAMSSEHASFTRRDGHGSRTFWYYSPLCAQMAGPKAVQAHMRNMRYFYTLSRRHDGAFIFLADWGIGGRGMRNPTATVALYYSMPLGKLMITGKDADTRVHMTDKEYEQLMFSARDQLGEPLLIKQAGKPMEDRSSDELIEMLDHFFPKRRFELIEELGKRYAAGEKDIPSKVLPRLASDSARMREGACRTLGACGDDVVLANLSKIAKLLDDEQEIGRIAAVEVIGNATKPGDKRRDLTLLVTAAEDFPGMTADNANLIHAVKELLLDTKVGQNLILTSPFKTGYDEDLVRTALAKIVTMDPSAAISSEWDKETVLKIAGPLTYVAFEPQINGKMFRGYREAGSRGLLKKFGYREGIEGEASGLIRRARADRDSRRFGSYNQFGGVDGQPGRYRFLLDALRELQFEHPTTMAGKTKTDPGIPLNEVIEQIEKDTTTSDSRSISEDVEPVFLAELAKAGDEKAQVMRCCAELAAKDRRNYIRKQLAMSWLARTFGVKVMDLITPHLGHDFWSVDEQAQKVVGELVKQGGGDRLIELFKAAQARVIEYGTGNANAAAMLMVLADQEYKPALAVAKAALQHRDPLIRRAAVQAVSAIGGDAELSTVFAFLRQAKASEELMGSERALLRWRDDPAYVTKVARVARALLARTEPPQRGSVAWVLGQFGGAENLLALERAAASTGDREDREDLLRALALSPDRAATQNMLKLLAVNEAVRDAVAPLFIHRMLTPKGWNDVTDEERVRLARSVLNLKFDEGVITLLGRTHTAASLQLLYDIMKVKPEMVATVLVECAEGINKPSKTEAKLAKEVLTEAIEFMEVTWLRQGPIMVTKGRAKGQISSEYLARKALQARAGKALLNFAAPETDAGATMEGIDFDL